MVYAMKNYLRKKTATSHTHICAKCDGGRERERVDGDGGKKCGKYSQYKHRIKQNIKIIGNRQQQLVETETETKRSEWTHELIRAKRAQTPTKRWQPTE